MFALIWSHVALERLADIYVTATADERERVAAGVEALNARLRVDPLDEGESRPSDRRITFPPLLAVTFRVIEKDQVVYVIGVRRYGK